MSLNLITVRSAGGRVRRRGESGSIRRDEHPPDHAVLLIVVALAAVGILMVYSSSAMRAYVRWEDSFRIVGPQLQWAVLGLLAMFIMARLDYRYLRYAAVPLYLVALLLLVLVLVPGLGIRVGGSARWLELGPLPAIHPAELAKLALVVYLAYWFSRRGTAVRSLLQGTLPFFVIVVPILVLVLREPDLGTSVVIGITAFVMYFAAGANLLHLAVIGPLSAFGASLLILRTPYMFDRVRAFLDPWSDPQGIGFQTIQALLALGLGGLLGAGLGESRQAGGLFLPNASNDFIFAIIGEEFGLVGGLTVIILFLALAYRGIKIALRAPDTFGALLAAGISCWLGAQAFINIGVVIALVPITGITLPFISAGGSSLIISFAAAGILLSISRETVNAGAWNDAVADRRRGYGRAHLPGPRGGASTVRQPGES